MRVRVALLALLIIAPLSYNALVVSGSAFEIGYDDGVFEYTVSDFSPFAEAVRFSPPSQSWSVSEIEFYGICYLRKESIGTFLVEIWDQGLSPIYRESLSFKSLFAGKNETFGWYSVKVPNVIVSGDFYAVIVPSLTLDGPQLWIGADSNGQISNRSFLVDSQNNIVIQSWNASSNRPKNLMIRVVGEPVVAPPELKMTSMDLTKDGFKVEFRLLRATVRNIQAKIFMRYTQREVECTVSIVDDSAFSVFTEQQGRLMVYVTTDHGTITTSLEIKAEIKSSYDDLLIRAWELGNESAILSRSNEELTDENSLLKMQVNQSEIFISVLGGRIDKLNQNVTALTRASTELRNENGLLRIGISVSVGLLIVVGLIEVRRRWKH